MDFKYRSTFTASARVATITDQDRFVAKASLLPLKGILPADVDPAADPDLLFFSCNGAVGGLINRNGDGISCATALAIHKTARNKYVSTDHERNSVVGVVLYPGLSRFGSNEPLTEEQAAVSTEPFNMSFAGVLWRVISPKLATYISHVDTGEDSLSMSWEIAFNSYDIGVGSRNLFDAQVIKADDPSFEAYDRLLRTNGGDGKDPAGKEVFRIIGDDAIILGYSIVPNPAAEVKGILPIIDRAEDVVPAAPDSAAQTTISQKSEEKNITSSAARVNPNTEQTMSIKIDNLAELESQWSEIRKMESAAAVADFVKAIQKGSEDFVKQLEEKANLAKTAEEARAAIEKRSKELQASIDGLTAELADVKGKAEAAEAAQKYQDRMEALEQEFDLDDEDRKILGSDVKDINDEAFAAYMSKCKKLMAGKKKKAKADPEDGDASTKSDPADPSDENPDDEDDGDEGKKNGKKTKDSSAFVKDAFASVKADEKDPQFRDAPLLDKSMLAEMAEAFGASLKIDGKKIETKK